MIVARELTVGFGSAEVLSGVDIEAPAGAVTALVGANGAGKTTLLRALSGLYPLRGGSVTFDGAPLAGVAPHLVARRGLVHVPQGRMIIPGLTVEENLEIGARQVPDLAASEIAATVAREYERFPVLGERRRILGTSLSGGEQQMLAVSRALMMRPKAIMLDEPSLGLAPQIVLQIFAVLREIADAGVAVLLVEQAAIAALRLADVGYVLKTGRIALSGDTGALLEDPNLVTQYLG